MQILVFPQHHGQWCWALHGIDGIPMAVSGGAFPTYAQAMTDAQASLNEIRDAVVEEDGYIVIPRPKHLEGSVLRR